LSFGNTFKRAIIQIILAQRGLERYFNNYFSYFYEYD